MQVTGSENILLMLDGHSFSLAAHAVAEYRANHGGRVPVVSLDTPKTILMPAYLYEKGVEADYLRFNGMEPTDAETAAVSEEQDGIVAVMAVSTAVAELVAREFGEGVRFTSPLLEIASGRKRDVNIFLTRDNLYFTVWDKELKMAEALPDNTGDSLLYCMQVIGRRFKLRRFAINVSGEAAEEAGRVLGEYFPKVNVIPE